MELTVQAFRQYRKKNPGGVSPEAFLIWKKEGGKDKDGYVYIPKKKKKPKKPKKKQNKEKEKKMTTSIKKTNFIFKKGSKPTIHYH